MVPPDGNRIALIEWMGQDRARQSLAAIAERDVWIDHPTVERGSEQFYGLVLAEAKGES